MVKYLKEKEYPVEGERGIRVLGRGLEYLEESHHRRTTEPSINAQDEQGAPGLKVRRNIKAAAVNRTIDRQATSVRPAHNGGEDQRQVHLW